MHGTKTGLFTGAPAMNFAALKSDTGLELLQINVPCSRGGGATFA